MNARHVRRSLPARGRRRDPDVLAGCSPTTRPWAPSVTVPVPGERETLFGTRSTGVTRPSRTHWPGRTAPTAGSRSARIFYPGDPPPWPGSPAAEADRPVVVSFKLPPADVIAGVHDAALRQWFESIPADHPVWWTYFHEPENDSEDGAFTPEQFRAAFRHVSELAKASARPNVHAALILQCRTASPDSGRSLSTWDPGADTYDVLGFDCYNRQAADGVYPDPRRVARTGRGGGGSRGPSPGTGRDGLRARGGRRRHRPGALARGGRRVHDRPGFPLRVVLRLAHHRHGLSPERPALPSRLADRDHGQP